MSNPFKVRDKVRLNAEGRKVLRSIPELHELVLTVKECEDNRILIDWKEGISSLRYPEEWWDHLYFELARPAEPIKFTLEFTNVDDAIRAAEVLAPTFGTMEVKPHY